MLAQPESGTHARSLLSNGRRSRARGPASDYLANGKHGQRRGGSGTLRTPPPGMRRVAGDRKEWARLAEGNDHRVKKSGWGMINVDRRRKPAPRWVVDLLAGLGAGDPLVVLEWPGQEDAINAHVPRALACQSAAAILRPIRWLGRGDAASVPRRPELCYPRKDSPCSCMTSAVVLSGSSISSPPIGVVGKACASGGQADD